MTFFSFGPSPQAAAAPVEPDGLSGDDARAAWRLLRAMSPATRHATLPRLAQVLTRLTPDDLVTLGLLKRTSERSHHGSHGPSGDGGTLHLALSGDGRHAALAWSPDPGDGSLLWVDGAPVDGPRDEQGLLPTDGPGHWCGNRVFKAMLVPVAHPLQNWSVPFSRGLQRGLLLVDAVTGRQWVEWPRDDELWAWPLVFEADGELLLFADDEARDAGRVARRVPLDPA